MAAGLLAFVQLRRPRHRFVPHIDTLVLAIPGAMAVWLVLAEQFVHQPGISVAWVLVLLAYPIGDVLLLAAGLYLMVAFTAARTTSLRLILVGLGLLLAADIVYAAQIAAGSYRGGPIDLVWLASYLLIGLSALVPSMASLSEPVSSRTETRGAWGIFVPAMAVAAVPAFAVTQHFTVGHIDLDFVAVVQVYLGALLLLRLGDLWLTSLREERDNARAQLAAAAQLHEQSSILSSVRESVVKVDRYGIVQYWNAGAEQITGVAASEIIGKSICEFYDAEDQAGAMRAEFAQLALRGHDTVDWFGRRRDGGRFVLELRRSVVQDASGEVVGFIGIGADVTEQRAARHHLQRLATAIEQSSEAVMIVDDSDRIEYVNSAFERVSGYTMAEAIGSPPDKLLNGHHPKSFERAMRDSLQAGKPWIADTQHRRKDGSLFDSSTVISPIRDGTGRITGSVWVARDVTAERQLEKRAQQLARERALIAQTLREMNVTATPQQTAMRICSQVGSLTDIAFACLYTFSGSAAIPLGFVLANGEDAPLYQLRRWRADYLLSRATAGPWIEAWRPMREHPYAALFEQLGVTACAYAPIRVDDTILGLLIIGAAGQSAEQVLSANLAAAIEFADLAAAQLGNALVEQSRLRSARDRIGEVIRKRQFQTVFQPIVELDGAAVVGYEALTRFDDGTAPDRRIADAALVGKQVDLELALMRTAIDSARGLPQGTWLNVNASPRTILDRRLAVILAVADRPIVLEVTEHAEIDDYVAFREAVARLGDNVTLAIDDAGAGFASLRHILELDPAMVKLDRALVNGVAEDRARQSLIAGVLYFAKASGFTVLAEGVEEVAELASVKQLGARYAQGYALAKPMDLADAAAWTVPAPVRAGLAKAARGLDGARGEGAANRRRSGEEVILAGRSLVEQIAPRRVHGSARSAR